MIGFDAIALLRRPAATERTRVLDEGQQFIELRRTDLDRLVAAYRANGMSGRPERLQRRFDHGMRCFGIDERGELYRLGDVARHAEHDVGTVHGGDLVDDGFDPLVTEVGDDDPGPLIGEQVSGRSPHPARRAGDDRDLPLDRS